MPMFAEIEAPVLQIPVIAGQRCVEPNLQSEEAGEHDVVAPYRVGIQSEVAPGVLPGPIAPYLSVAVGVDQSALRAREVAVEVRCVMRLADREGVAEIVDLVAERRGLKLVDFVVAGEVARLLKSAVDHVTQTGQRLRAKLKLIWRWRSDRPFARG